MTANTLVSFQYLTMPSSMADIKKLPVLSREEEYELARKYKEENDIEAAKILVISNMRFVYYTAQKYQGYGLDVNDLVQEGAIGLMNAIKRFDYTKNIRLITFAVYWIKAQIHEFILRNWRIVKIATTKAQRTLFFKLRSKKTKEGWLTEQEAQFIADDLKTSKKNVLEMEKRLSAKDCGFDRPNPYEANSNQPPTSLENILHSDEKTPENELVDHYHMRAQLKKLENSLQALNLKEQTIIKKRWLTDKKTTFKELAKNYNVSIERIRQIEQESLMKLKKSFKFN